MSMSMAQIKLSDNEKKIEQQVLSKVGIPANYVGLGIKLAWTADGINRYRVNLFVTKPLTEDSICADNVIRGSWFIITDNQFNITHLMGNQGELIEWAKFDPTRYSQVRKDGIAKSNYTGTSTVTSTVNTINTIPKKDVVVESIVLVEPSE